jgi:uncharacterized protein (DUF58 family)
MSAVARSAPRAPSLRHSIAPQTVRGAAARSTAAAASARVTKVGLWFVLLALVVGIAATNTGNNSLYMVVASMGGLLVVSWVLAWRNLRRIEVELVVPDEVYAHSPFVMEYRAHNRRRGAAWLVTVQVDDGRPFLLERLPGTRDRGEPQRGGTMLLIARRGRRSECLVRCSSLFPLGLFRSGLVLPVVVDLVVFPELFSAASLDLEVAYDFGSQGARRAGWGYDLFALRAFREGDDRRAIHWKRSARTGSLVYMEREAEQSRRLAVILDNAVAASGDATIDQRFERLVSEAATASIDFIERGYEVELVTRSGTLPFASGAQQRWQVLDVLALLEPVVLEPGRASPLRSSGNVPELRLGLDRPAERRAG